MAKFKLDNIAPTLQALAGMEAEIKKIKANAEVILDEIRPALIGLSVKKYGHKWQIVQARISLEGYIHVYGVRVSKAGKVGTRGYDLHRLSLCEVVED
jgi:hypothetical protein